MNFLKELETRFLESQTQQPEQTFFEFARNELHKLGLNLYSDDKYNTWITRYRGTKKGLDFENSVVRYGRSLITDGKTHETLMVAPPKSWAYEDFRKNHPDVSMVQVEDFPSGPMVNVFWHDGKWVMSTRSYVGAENNFRSTKSFKTLFEECFKNATSLTFDQAVEQGHFDQNLTYSWVLQHPDFLDVVRPHEAVLYLVEVRDRQKGHVLSDLSVISAVFQKNNWKIKFPKRHNFQTWDEVDTFVKEQACDDQGLVFRSDQERSKVRNPEFINARLLLGNHSKTLEMFAENRQNKTMKEFLAYFPEFGGDFHDLENYVEKLAVEIHSNYLATNTRPKADRIDFRKEIPVCLQTACFNIHQEYWNSGNDVKSRKPVHLETVRDYIDRMPHMFLANMIYSHKEESKNTSAKLDNLQKMRQATEQHHQTVYKPKQYPKQPHDAKDRFTRPSKHPKHPNVSTQKPPQRTNSQNTTGQEQVQYEVYTPVVDTNPHSYANIAKATPKLTTSEEDDTQENTSVNTSVNDV
jgi:hypothetical protein